jgi:hypothetical protein
LVRKKKKMARRAAFPPRAVEGEVQPIQRDQVSDLSKRRGGQRRGFQGLLASEPSSEEDPIAENIFSSLSPFSDTQPRSQERTATERQRQRETERETERERKTETDGEGQRQRDRGEQQRTCSFK